MTWREGQDPVERGERSAERSRRNPGKVEPLDAATTDTERRREKYALDIKAEQDPSILAGGAGTPVAEETPAEEAPAEAAPEATEEAPAEPVAAAETPVEESADSTEAPESTEA